MVSLMEFLPLMVDDYGQPVGWVPKYDSVDRVLQPGNKYNIGPFDQPGWIRWVTGITNNQFTTIDQNVWGKSMTFSPYSLFSIGETSFDRVAWVQLYDVANSLFKVLYQPDPPQEFLKGTDIWVTAPNIDPTTGLPITTPTYITLTWHIILIRDRRLFLDKLQEVLGTKKVIL